MTEEQLEIILKAKDETGSTFKAVHSHMNSLAGQMQDLKVKTAALAVVKAKLQQELAAVKNQMQGEAGASKTLKDACASLKLQLSAVSVDLAKANVATKELKVSHVAAASAAKQFAAEEKEVAKAAKAAAKEAKEAAKELEKAAKKGNTVSQAMMAMNRLFGGGGIRKMTGASQLFGATGVAVSSAIFDVQQIFSVIGRVAGAVLSLGRVLFSVLSSAVRWVWNLATAIASRLVGAILTATKVAAGLGLALAGALGYVAKKGIDYNAMMERYATTLTVVLGSAKKSAEALIWLREFAAKTPFELPEIVSAGQLLATYQLDFKRWIPLAGDIASAFGGTAEQINEVVSALGRISAGQMGEAMEILRRFGIGAAALTGAGLTINKAGQIENTPEEVLNAVEKIIKSRYPGMMATLAKTTVGMLSNLKDAIGIAVGEITKGLSGAFQTALASFLKFIDAFKASSGGMALFGNVGGVFTGIGKIIEWVESKAEQFFTWLGVMAEEGAISKFLAKAQEYAEVVVSNIANAGKNLARAWPTIWKTLVTTVDIAGGLLIGLLNWISENWEKVWNFAGQIMGKVGEITLRTIGAIAGALNEFLDIIAANGGGWKGLGLVVQEVMAFMVQTVTYGVGKIVKQLGELELIAGATMELLGLIPGMQALVAPGTALIGKGAVTFSAGHLIIKGGEATAKEIRKGRTLDLDNILANIKSQMPETSKILEGFRSGWRAPGPELQEMKQRINLQLGKEGLTKPDFSPLSERIPPESMGASLDALRERMRANQTDAIPPIQTQPAETRPPLGKIEININIDGGVYGKDGANQLSDDVVSRIVDLFQSAQLRGAFT